MSGYWFDDTPWIINYFIHETYKGYINAWAELRHEIVGTIVYLCILIVNKFGFGGLLFWSFLKFLLLLFNSFFLYILIKKITNKNEFISSTIAILFLLSPLVNNISMVMIPYNFFVFLYLLSLITFTKCLEKQNIINRYYIFSILLLLIPLFGLESFIFLEISRLFIIIIVLRRKKINYQKIFLKTIKIFLPFLLLVILVLVKTIFFQTFNYYSAIYDSKLELYTFIPKLILNYFAAFQYIYYDVYWINLKIFFNNTSFGFVQFFLSFLSASFFYYFFLNTKENSYKFKESKELAIFGLLLLLAGLFPYLITRTVGQFGNDSRHYLLASIGNAIFIGASLNYLLSKLHISRFLFNFIILALVFIGSISAINNVKGYMNHWQQQQNLYWQLAWRIPDLQDNSFFMIDMTMKDGHYLKQYAFHPLNLLFSKNKQDLVGIVSEPFETGLDERSKRYWFNKEGYYSYYSKILKPTRENLILVSQNKGCMKINEDIYANRCPDKKFYPILDNQPNLPPSCEMNIGPLIHKINSKQINYSVKKNNTHFKYRWLFGPEPSTSKDQSFYQKLQEKITGTKLRKGWCYYYQTANVELNNKRYDNVINIYNEAKNSDLIYMEQYSELHVFINAFYLENDFANGKKLLWMWATAENGKLMYVNNLFSFIYQYGSTTVVEKFKKDIKEIYNIDFIEF